MKHKVRSLLLALCMLSLSLTACNSADSSQTVSPTPSSAAPIQSAAADKTSREPVTITNFNYAGEPVEYTYDKVPDRVLCVYQGCIETMIALGLEDHVIASYGLDNEVKEEWKDGFAKMHYDESVFAPDKETVTLLEPDFIFSWGSYFSEKKLGDVDQWNAKGIGTYMNSNTAPGNTRTLENEYADILNIGTIFDVEERAQALVDEMKSAVADTLAAAEGQDSVRVAVVEPTSSGSITNYGSNSLAGDMVTALGGELAKPEGNEMGKEDLIACDPDVIFVVYMAYSGDDPESVKAAQLAAIQEDPALSSLSAVQSGRIYLIMLGDMYASGPRTLDGLNTLAQGMYPGLVL